MSTQSRVISLLLLSKEVVLDKLTHQDDVFLKESIISDIQNMLLSFDDEATVVNVFLIIRAPLMKPL